MTQETRRRIEAVRHWMAALPADRRATAAVRTPRFSRGIEPPPVPLDRLHVARVNDDAPRHTHPAQPAA